MTPIVSRAECGSGLVYRSAFLRHEGGGTVAVVAYPTCVDVLVSGMAVARRYRDDGEALGSTIAAAVAEAARICAPGWTTPVADLGRRCGEALLAEVTE